MARDFFENSRVEEILRSQIKPSDYNPRKITPEGKKQLIRSIKKYGVVGGIIINEQTGNTIVGGHQKVAVLDEMNKYDPVTKENDYTLRVEVINVDLKTEKSLNTALNNPNIGGDWDYDKLRELIPDIDWKDAGFTEADLSMIGVDFMLQTEGENDITNELAGLAAPAQQKREEEKAAKKEEANRIAAMEHEINQQMTQEQKTQHMKDVKAQVQQKAVQDAQNMDAYVVLSFDSYEAKADFCERFGYIGQTKFIKGEEFDDRCEVVID